MTNTGVDHFIVDSRHNDIKLPTNHLVGTKCGNMATSLNMTRGLYTTQDVIEIASESHDGFDFTQFLNFAPENTISPTYLISDSEDDLEMEVRKGRPRSSVARTDPKELYQLFQNKILEVFPDICLDYIRLQYDAQAQAFGPQMSATPHEDMSEGIIRKIIDMESYPKQNDQRRKLKRKRSNDAEDESQDLEWMAKDRPVAVTAEIQEARLILLGEFVTVPVTFIDQQIKIYGHLYHAYIAIQQAERTYSSTDFPLYVKLRKARKKKSVQTDTQSLDSLGNRLSRELAAARSKCSREEAKRIAVQVARDADAKLERDCLEEGRIIECQCCFVDVPIPKSTHCAEFHVFCLECARRNAESQIELGRYKLTCMDGSECKAEFSRTERLRFLDFKTFNLLDRLQQREELRTAGVDGLAFCPFCDYAAIYPPTDSNKVFECHNPECERASCRLCRQDSHIPKSCAENKKDQGVTERHAVEEAMTMALIKICPKCQVAIIKADGCNKLVCSKCRTMMCDVCGHDITKEGYKHFKDSASSHSPSVLKKCCLHDDANRRNDERVAAAEKQALAKVRAENPGISEEDLKIKFSKAVRDTRNLRLDPYGYPPRPGEVAYNRHFGPYDDRARLVMDNNDLRPFRNLPPPDIRPIATAYPAVYPADGAAGIARNAVLPGLQATQHPSDFPYGYVGTTAPPPPYGFGQPYYGQPIVAPNSVSAFLPGLPNTAKHPPALNIVPTVAPRRRHLVEALPNVANRVPVPRPLLNTATRSFVPHALPNTTLHQPIEWAITGRGAGSNQNKETMRGNGSLNPMRHE